MLVITIKCFLFFFFFKACEILFKDFNIYLFVKEPFGKLGVGKTKKVILVFRITSTIFFSYLKFLIFFLIYLFKFGSIFFLFFIIIFSIL